MTKKIVTRAALFDVLSQWQQQLMTTEKMQLWMLDNFEPDEYIIGQGESEEVVEAMHMVMNEYELADQDKCLSDKANLAIDFINTDSDSFISQKSEFLRNAFID